MKTKIYNFLETKVLVFLIIVFFSCSFQNNKSNLSSSAKGIEINIDNLNTDEVVNFSDVFEDYEIIPLETTNESLVGRIKSIRIIRDNIIVLDNSVAKAVFLFNIDGKFIRKIGALGKGPGEYIAPSSISADDAKGEIAVYDGMSNKILLYKINGDFIKSIKLHNKIGAKSMELYDGNIYIANYPHDVSHHLLYAIDIDGNLKGEWLPNEYPKGFMDNFQLSPSTIFYRTDNNLRYRSWLIDAIYNVEINSVQPFISLNSKNKLNVDELVDISNKNVNGNLFMSLNRKQKLIGITSYSEIKDLSIIEYLNNTQRFILFYNHNTGIIKCTTLLNFSDDMTNFSGRVSGFFHTIYEDKLVAVISGIMMEDLIESAMKENKLNYKPNLQKITVDSNPCIVMYKCKEKTIFNEK